MNVHLICNAHIDPVWLWEMDEGVAETLSTFKIAADFCESFDGFVFNHNESLLYEWVLEYAPDLFSRIQKLVLDGKWHIMGGWFLQPDCNMPSGESIIRQIQTGRSFFRKHFQVEPTTAINFDPFGHSQGLVQILAKAGYDSYIVTRPSSTFCELPAEVVDWQGFDGTTVRVCRRSTYNSNYGEARAKIEQAIRNNAHESVISVLWGIGNHGGGPSRYDLEMIQELASELRKNEGSIELIHSTPEAFFAEYETVDRHTPNQATVPQWNRDMNPWAPGCYTSQIRIKQQHRLLENLLYSTERVATVLNWQNSTAYPSVELESAERDLLIAEFHDILPGSSIAAVEEASLRILAHGIETLTRIRRKQFFTLLEGSPSPPENSIPIYAFNVQPYTVEGVFECEFQPSRQNWGNTFTAYTMSDAIGEEIPVQVEHEDSNLSIDWRKRVVFQTELPAMTLVRLDCYPQVHEKKPPVHQPNDGEDIVVAGVDFSFRISSRDGLVHCIKTASASAVEHEVLNLVVVEDNEDAWGSMVRGYGKDIGIFTLLSEYQAKELCGLPESNTLAPVRVIEDGPVRTVVEALYGYHNSYAIVHYLIPKRGKSFDVSVRLQWLEKNAAVKLSTSLSTPDARAIGQVMFGHKELSPGDEEVSQRWQVIYDNKHAIAVINDGTYGCDFRNGTLRQTLLRSPVYSALTIKDRPLVSGDRYHVRVDQGERFFRFRILIDDAEQIMSRLEREALAYNESPFFLSAYPASTNRFLQTDHSPVMSIDNEAIICTSLKKGRESGSDDSFIRLLNTSNDRQNCNVILHLWNRMHMVELGPREFVSYRFNPEGLWQSVDVLDNPARINGNK